MEYIGRLRTDPEPLFFTIEMLTKRKRNGNGTQTKRKRLALKR